MEVIGVRKQRTQRTRQRICGAAKALFLERGYRATTITDIAKAAGVAHQTVYFTFGSKAALLSTILDTEVVGDTETIPLLDRPDVAAIAQLSDPMRRLHRVVDLSCTITEHLAPLYEIARSSAADDEVAELLDKHESQRWSTLRGFVGMIEGDLPLNCELDDAADRLYAMLSHEQFWLLVQRRRWSPERWREYVAVQAERELLPADVR